ncbi:hypothetical protein [Streptomyces sp. NPDC093591]|uniref:hypothetical protein n=1 Tax=Streptomyces sp. NPDC093591 TaxID=3366044 RepID=UPI00381F69AB
MKAILKTRGVGPDAKPPAIPPKPTGRPRDWLDDILDTKPAPQPEAAQEPEPAPAPVEKTTLKPPATKPKKARRERRKRPQPDTPRSAFDTRPPSPRQSLIEAWDRVPYRLKWLAFHASAAYLGWTVGLVGWVTYVTAWIVSTSPYGPQAIFWCIVGAATLLLHHRTRSWWRPVAWLAAVPASSTVVGVLLYGTGYHL